MSDKEIIDRVRTIRRNNNDLWMRLLEIAIEHAPVEAKTVLRQINVNDLAVSGLIGELAR
jgi:hypothetical protein